MPDITLQIVESAPLDLNISSGTPIELNFGHGAVGVPPGGASGEVLTKINGTDYNTEWAAPGAASLVKTFVAGENLSTGRAVVAVDNEAFYFQPSNVSHAGRMIGVTKTSGSVGQSVNVQFAGHITDGALSFAPNLPLWADTDGEIVDAQNPAWLIIQKAGVSIEGDAMLIDFSVSIKK